MNNENLDDFVRNVTDAYLFETISAIFKRAFPEDSIFIPFLNLSKKYGMPVKNILPFMKELAEWCEHHMPDQDALSEEDRKTLSDMLSRSGFMTIGFNPKGDDGIGNG